jgi:hypothetical protein
MKRALIVATLVSSLASCYSAANLRYPDGRVVECPWPYGDAAVAAAIQGQCIHDHMAQGAVRQ